MKELCDRKTVQNIEDLTLGKLTFKHASNLFVRTVRTFSQGHYRTHCVRLPRQRNDGAVQAFPRCVLCVLCAAYC